MQDMDDKTDVEASDEEAGDEDEGFDADQAIELDPAGEDGDAGAHAAAADSAAEEALDEADAEAEAADQDAAAIADDPIASLTAEVAELRDQILRQRAETENVRKRGQREREDATKFAASNFAKDLLPVADNLRRALDSVAGDDDQAAEKLTALCEGIELVERELLAAFERHGIERIEPVGEKFDHAVHQAMFEVPDSDQPPGTVVRVLAAGYVLNGRLLRPAMVGVAKGAASETEGVDTSA